MMNLKRLLLFAVMPMACLAGNAQQSCPQKKFDFTPKKNDFTVALTVGYNSYANVKTLPTYSTTYEGEALSTDWSKKMLMVGIEGGWFFNDLWKLNLGGGLNFTNNPGYAAVPGTIDENTEPGDGSIPNYRAVADQYSFGYNVFTGVDRYFPIARVPNLMWYTGARVGFIYALNEAKYDEPEAMGKSTAEAFNVRGSIAVGIDYYVLPALYIGAQVEPFAYTYNVTKYRPQEGLSLLDANSHNFSVLAAPTLKIGFKFGKSNKGCQVYGNSSNEECLQKINELRELLEKPRVEYRTDTVVVEKPAISKPGLKSFVTFTIGRSEVAAKQEMNIQAAADYLKQYPEAKVKVVGYADTATGNEQINSRLSKARAEAVAQLLTGKYGVDKSRVDVSSMVDGEQPFQTIDWNRVAILLAE